MKNELNTIYNKSKRININNSSKIVIMSDCHRGSGDNYDNFIKNKNIYEAALIYYYNNDFTYVELGDGDEMWEVKKYNDIVDIHLNIYKHLKKFYERNRLIMIYGNHDIIKKDKKVLEKYFYKYYDQIEKEDKDLLNGLEVFEALILNYKGNDIFLIHGHQVDFFNNELWKVSRFLVRYVWRILEYIGIKDPTSAAKNYNISKRVEKKLSDWSIENNKIIISGHTHRPVFPQDNESLYFNDGSCIHPNGITAIEIENGGIALVRWQYEINSDNQIIVKRKILNGSEPIINFYMNK